MHESVQKGETRPTSQQLRILLEVAEAIVSNRELSAVFKNLAGLLQLNSYGAVRRPIARQVVALADRLTRLATVSRQLRPLRNTLLRLLACIPSFRHRLAWRLSGLAYR